MNRSVAVCILVVCFGQSAVAQYTHHDLGAILGFEKSQASAISSSGRIAAFGFATDNGGGYASAGFAWRLGQRTVIPIGAPNDVNDRGDIVGAAMPGGYGGAFLYRNGTLTHLGSLGGYFAYANAINNRAVIVGTSTLTTVLGDYRFHAFVWANGALSDLGTLGGDLSGAHDVNNAGWIVGFADLPNHDRHATLWRDGAIVDLGILPERYYGEALAVNERGQIVGFSYDPSFTPQAFRWQDGKTVELPPLPGYPGAVATAINNRGVIVGYSVYYGPEYSYPRATIWIDGDPYPLPEPVGGISAATDINDRGDIVGYSLFPVGAFVGPRATLWTRE